MLGTSTADEAREYFWDLTKNQMEYMPGDSMEECNKSILYDSFSVGMGYQGYQGQQPHLSMAVHKDEGSFQQRGEIGGCHQFVILAHQSKRLEACLRSFWMESCHVD